MDHDATPFRTATLPCPRCRTAPLTGGELRHCPNCQGSWIPEEALHARFTTMTSEIKPQIRWEVTPARLGLPCAACGHTMEALLLFDVPVDRCHAHGVWFDKDELAAVLHRSAQVRPQSPANAGDAGTALAAAEVGGSVAADVAIEVVPGILEGVLEVLGGIFSAIDF